MQAGAYLVLQVINPRLEHRITELGVRFQSDPALLADHLNIGGRWSYDYSIRQRIVRRVLLGEKR